MSRTLHGLKAQGRNNQTPKKNENQHGKNRRNTQSAEHLEGTYDQERERGRAREGGRGGRERTSEEHFEYE